MYSSKKIARLAGALYLIVVISGIFHLMYVPSQLMDWNNPSLTVSNITNNETLFRFGIVGGIICYMAFLFLPLALYKLLSPVNKAHAILMVSLAVVSVPLSFVNLLNKFAVLTLIGKDNYLAAVDPGQLQTQIMLHLDFYRNGNSLTTIFWGLWLFPLGYLVFKSGFLPRILGIFLMLGCIGYVINFMGGFFSETYSDSLTASLLSIPSGIGEIGICLWLLIAGVKNSTTVIPQ
jgi:hypothetical protein